MKSPRLWFIVLAMLLAAAVLQVRGDQDRVPHSQPLSQLPTVIGARRSTDIPLDQETLDVLGKGDFLNRVYLRPGQTTASPEQVELFIAYFPTQRTGQSIHSPQNCLPGAGWTFQSRGRTTLTDAAGKTYSVGDYVIAKGSESMEVLYWYQMQGRSIANDYKAKLYTLEESIRDDRTDAALIRVSTPIVPGENGLEAHKRVVDFAEQLTPLLPAYIPN